VCTGWGDHYCVFLSEFFGLVLEEGRKYNRLEIRPSRELIHQEGQEKLAVTRVGVLLQWLIQDQEAGMLSGWVLRGCRKRKTIGATNLD
jgi:hypothetical protein